MKKLLLLLGIISVLSSCGNAEKHKQNFTDSEIAKYTIASIMNQSPNIIEVKESDKILITSYLRPDDGKKFEQKVKVQGDKVVWGAYDGRWRDSEYDEKITYEINGNQLSIIQTFPDGSKIEKEYTKTEQSNSKD